MPLFNNLKTFGIRKAVRMINVFFRLFGIAIVRRTPPKAGLPHRPCEPAFGAAYFQFNEAENIRILRQVFPQLKREYSSFQYSKPSPCLKDKIDPFYLFNGLYQAGDAEALYCFVRHFSPRRIIEVGCGYSTMVIRKAIGKNKTPCLLTCIDPSPQYDISMFADKIFLNRVEELNKDVFEGLGANDILFIDTSHTVTKRSYIVYLILEILPSLKPGVIVHIHDFFLPFDYPPHVEYWNEQYVVQAFLTFNKLYEVFWAASFMRSKYPQEMCEVFPSLKHAGDDFPCSLWIRRLN